MRADRVIVRTIFTTFLSVVMLFGAMLLMLYLLFPGTLMGITYDLGMERSSMNNARRAYNRTNDVYYIATAFETATEIEDLARVEEYGQLLIKDNEFATYCEHRNSKIDKDEVSITYEHYVYGQVVMAKYSNGKTGDAIDTAFWSVDSGFPKNNAMVILYLTALKTGDAQTFETVKAKMDSIYATMEDGNADKAYLEDLLALANK